MARKPRIHVPGGFYHVMMRGNGGGDIFFDDDDRYYFYFLVQQGVERYGHRIHGFCCMTNHVHLAIQVGDIPLSKIVQNLSFRYTRWVNQRLNRIGHLFQGRYKAILIDADSYLLELVRYIHLNPCRAGIVKNPKEYPWSGHRAYLGEEHFSWLTTDWILSQFSQQKAAAKRQYAKFIQCGLGEGYRIEFHSGGEEDARILGQDRFVERIYENDEPRLTPPSVNKITQVVCQDYSIKAKELSGRSRQRRLAEARGVIAWLVVQNESGTLTELAQKFHRDLSAVSVAVRKIDERRKEEKAFDHKLVKLENSITQA